MKKIFLLTILFFSFSKASYLLYLEQEKNKGVKMYCIEQYEFNNTTFDYVLTSNKQWRTINSAQYQKIQIEDGYKYENGFCSSVVGSETYGLPYEEYNFLMALFGIVVVFLFGLTFLTGL